MRVHCFVDGFNLYHSIMRNPRLRGYRWLDLRSLADSFVGCKDTVCGVHYFTAFYPGDSEKRIRHQIYIDAQESVGVRVILGAFRRKEKYCPECGRGFIGYEEKETDVNIAVELLKGAFTDAYDKALVVSGDSDLVPAIRTVCEVFPEKKITVVFPPEHRSTKALKLVASGYMRMNEDHLRNNQFPEMFECRDKKLRKPHGW